MVDWPLRNSDEGILLPIAEIGKDLADPCMDNRIELRDW
jgi:hypothetical protein